MKNLFTVFTLLVSVISFSSVPELKMVPVTHIFVPQGFDSNDSAEIVVKGFLPNLCHKSPKATVKVSASDVHVTVESLYYDESSPFCPEMVVPFDMTISLGVLKSKKFNIIVNEKSSTKLKSAINVTRSSGDKVDNHQYLNVSEVVQASNENTVILKGHNPSDCFVLDKVTHINNGLDTYSVMPKMKQVSSFCPMKMVPFEVKWKVPSTLKASEVLLHVRTLNGNSVNKLILNPSM